MLKFQCPLCSKKLAVPEEYCGKRVRCPGCSEPIDVPDQSPFGAVAADDLDSLSQGPAVDPPAPDPAPNDPDTQTRDALHPSDASRLAPTEVPDVSFAGVFVYPFKGAGKYLMLTYLIIIVAFRLGSMLPLMGIGFGLAGLVCSIYFLAFLISVVASSANGESEMPDWPSFTSWREDIVTPVLICYLQTALSFLPAIAYLVLAWFEVLAFSPPLAWALIALGCLVAPMVFLAAVLFSSVEAVNPVLIIGSIFRIFPAYLLTLAFLALVIVLESVINNLALPIPFLNAVIGIYSSMVMMRILGLLYYKNQHKLGWF